MMVCDDCLFGLDEGAVYCTLHQTVEFRQTCPDFRAAKSPEHKSTMSKALREALERAYKLEPMEDNINDM